LRFNAGRSDLLIKSERNAMAYVLKVNGKMQTVDVEADTPLLWVLRDTIGLVGTKFGCGMGLCGACTVHLDGVAVRGCQTPVSSVGIKSITTIEGVGATPIGEKVQKAWIDHDVIQCGYCQAGQIMSASALLAKTPQPTDVQIERAMSGNICRCATYTRIKSAIRQAAGLTPALAAAPAPQQVLAEASAPNKA
jgi:isoquinoline 1-oxidoreductase alpha subunit